MNRRLILDLFSTSCEIPSNLDLMKFYVPDKVDVVVVLSKIKKKSLNIYNVYHDTAFKRILELYRSYGGNCDNILPLPLVPCNYKNQECSFSGEPVPSCGFDNLIKIIKETGAKFVLGVGSQFKENIPRLCGFAELKALFINNLNYNFPINEENCVNLMTVFSPGFLYYAPQDRKECLKGILHRKISQLSQYVENITSIEKEIITEVEFGSVMERMGI